MTLNALGLKFQMVAFFVLETAGNFSICEFLDIFLQNTNQGLLNFIHDILRVNIRKEN